MDTPIRLIALACPVRPADDRPVTIIESCLRVGQETESIRPFSKLLLLLRSKDRADRPGGELIVAQILHFALGSFAAGNRDDFFKQRSAHFFNGDAA